MDDPYRIAIDLPDLQWKAGNLVPLNLSGLTALRYGPLQNGISRIVFDLNRPVTISSAFILPHDQKQPDRLVIDYARATDAQFRSNLGITHGSLPVAAPAPQTTQYLKKPASAPSPQKIADTPPPPKTTSKKPLIIIDAGHGGPDSGTIGVNRVMEKNVTLAIARELGRQLANSGDYRVLLTRDTDVFIPLKERVNFARRNNGDLFVSIHADSIDKPGVDGASIYTLSDKASDAQSAKLAARENRADAIGGIDLSNEDQDVASILVDLAMRDTMNQSRFFAGKVAKIFRSLDLDLLESPTRSAGFAVLKAPDIPSILLETGYLSNRSEARLLSSPEHQKTIALALKRSIDAYFDQVRRNQRP